jgi:hypothetical protein
VNHSGSVIGSRHFRKSWSFYFRMGFALGDLFVLLQQ